MKTTAAVVAAVLLMGDAWAQAPAAPGDGSDGPGEQFQKRARMMRTLAIADALGLDDASALKLREQLGRFEERRAPLQAQLVEQTLVLRRAAKGDTTAFAQVDGAITKILALKGQVEQIDRELFAELSAGLTPQKKARLALAMARLPQQVREMAQGKAGR
jgi:hypothetical protein